MRGIVCLLGILSITVFSRLHAQDRARDAEPKVLFGSENIAISGFGGIIVEFSSIEGNAAITNGGEGAVLFNRSIYLGGYGVSLSNSLHKEVGGIRRNVSANHGGLIVGYVLFPHKLLHFGLSNKIGWGVLRLNPEDALLPTIAPISDNLFVWQPQIEGEMNFSNWFKVNAGIGYRTVRGVNNSYYKNTDLNSPILTLSFLFGWFK